MDIPLDEVIYVEAISSSATGAAADADATPTFAVYEEATDTDIGVGGNMTKRTSLTGDYRASFTASAANGFEVGKWYAVIGSATIGTIACKGVLARFRIVLAESVAGAPKTDLTYILGTLLTETAGLIAAGFKKFFNVASPTGTVNSLPDAVPGAASGVFIAGTNAATVVTTSFTTTFTGNLTGSVGSVTGNVGGNVTGSVGSVTAAVTVGTNNDKTGYALTSAYDPAKTAAQQTTLTAGIASILAAIGTPIQVGGTVILAASQPNYAPAIAGDAMTLTAAYDSAKTAAQQSTLTAGIASILAAIGTPIQVGGTVTLDPGEYNAIADALLDRTDGIETGVTPRNANRRILAATAGKSNGFPAGPGHFRDPADAKNRITVAMDGTGNRTAVTYDDT